MKMLLKISGKSRYETAYNLVRDFLTAMYPTEGANTVQQRS
jgi:hypothetical protein